MTRYKEELRKHGFKLEQDYPWLPYEQGNIVIEGVRVKIDNSLILICTDYNVALELNLSTEISLLSIEISTRKGGQQCQKIPTSAYA